MKNYDPISISDNCSSALGRHSKLKARTLIRIATEERHHSAALRRLVETGLWTPISISVIATDRQGVRSDK
ncbi:MULTISPECIES: hypothetical protein [Pseudomonas]|uniref:hypothetical protein n=1 Tax=Pseudomonas TaxID=286 RepID=UPI00115C116A|nr:MULTISPECIES: hypothetical protein [Pseudomonas]MBI6945518.1 hypothetical protein [Pseudomonas koreensis]MCU7213530.1 hypothetical protein [Pseudomonas sp. VE 196-7]